MSTPVTTVSRHQPARTEGPQTQGVRDLASTASGQSTIENADGSPLPEPTSPSCLMSTLDAIGKRICWFFEGIYNVFSMLFALICCSKNVFIFVDSIVLPQDEKNNSADASARLLEEFHYNLQAKNPNSSGLHLLQENSTLHQLLNDLYENFALVDAHALQGRTSAMTIEVTVENEWLKTFYTPVNSEKNPAFAQEREEALGSYLGFLFRHVKEKDKLEKFSLPLCIQTRVVSLDDHKVMTSIKHKEMNITKGEQVEPGKGFKSESYYDKSWAFTCDGARELFQAKAVELLGADNRLPFDETTQEPKVLVYSGFYSTERQ